MDDEQILNDKLKKYFYSEFKNSDYKETLLKFYNVDEREKVIKKLATNESEAYFYDKVYENILKEVSEIFKNNDIYKKAKKAEELENLNEENEIIEKMARAIPLTFASWIGALSGCLPVFIGLFLAQKANSAFTFFKLTIVIFIITLICIEIYLANKLKKLKSKKL